MNDEQIERTIREYIGQVIHLSLATCVDNKPWVCEVHFSYDDDLNLYFRSLSDRRHSTEIDKNPSVAGTIVTQHFLHQKVRGVYFEGRAERLREIKQNDAAYKAVQARFGDANIQAVTKEKVAASYYKITVTEWYVLDAYDATPPQKYHLAWEKGVKD